MAKKRVIKKTPSKEVMFKIDKSVALSEIRNNSDSEAVIKLAEVMSSLPEDEKSSILIALHVAKTKKEAQNIFLTAKRRLKDNAFVSRTILNVKGTYQGTRIWRIKKAK